MWMSLCTLCAYSLLAVDEAVVYNTRPDLLKVIVGECNCCVTLRTAPLGSVFETLARTDFTWFSYCQNHMEKQKKQKRG